MAEAKIAQKTSTSVADPTSVAPVLPQRRTEPVAQVALESSPITTDMVMQAEPVAVVAEPEAPAAPYAPYVPTEQMYEVVTDTWGSQPPVFYRGNTFVPSMLPPTRDLKWAEELMVVAKIAATDPRSIVPPTGPTGDQNGAPSDGWASAVNPHQITVDQVPAIVAAMQAAGATPAMIAAVRAQSGRLAPVGAPAIPPGTPGA